MQKLSSYMNLVIYQSIKNTYRIFTVIHISSDHFALDPKSHDHNDHIHITVVHTNHTHTSFVHITRARCNVVLSTPKLGPAHHRCPYLSSSFFLPLPKHINLIHVESSLLSISHLTTSYLATSHLIPSLMSTMTTSIQLPSTPITSTHPLSASRELDVVVLSTLEIGPAHHRCPYLSSSFFLPLPRHMNLVNNQSIEDTCGIFTVIHISSDHLLSDHFALDSKSHVHNDHIHTTFVHIHTSSVCITRARCRRPLHIEGRTCSPSSSLLLLQLLPPSPKTLATETAASTTISLLVRATEAMTEVVQSFISVHLHHRDPSSSISMAKLISFITKEHG
ncbi:hypothetical protein HID58_012326, partial [Brassica napus]